jgi:hypothetical protein
LKKAEVWLSGAAQIQVFHWCRPAHRNRPLKGALAYPRPPRYSILAGEWGRAGHADVDDRSQGRLQASKRLHDGQVASDGRIHPRSRSCGTAPPPHDGRGPRPVGRIATPPPPPPVLVVVLVHAPSPPHHQPTTGRAAFS